MRILVHRSSVSFIYSSNIIHCRDPGLLFMEYANEFHEIKKEEETDEECADESWPVERRELVDDDSNSKPQPQRENRVTPDQAVFNYLYQHKRSDLLETMFDEETRVEYTNKVENMGAAIPQIQRLYAYYRRHKPVKKEAVEESTDSRRGVVEVEAAVETPSPSDLKITPQLAIFYHLYERNRRDVLAEIFDEETRKELTRKVEKMGIDMPSILRMYAYWRRTELKRTVKNGIEIWLCHLCKKERKTGGERDLLNHAGTHEGISCSCVVDGCDKLVKPHTLRTHLVVC
ncbi:hypothetical protein QR680_007067 [Steinernema hermaphroditum]|uniref:Uncharacterized protein n=1 Tax=Steinernema hermaphroditum TaxID=289476 RepID=A0AA39HZW7_9BILA|nr:hypothetical protein QR680_007067 [Steinernema hermaphroditum]